MSSKKALILLLCLLLTACGWEGQGVVVTKGIQPEEVVWMLSGKVMVPIHLDAYPYVIVQDKDREMHKMKMLESDWQQVKPGQTVICRDNYCR